jgi:predicted transcriptional regulator
MSGVNNKYLFISVKPEFAEKIINNKKTIELRKLRPNVKRGDYIIIYASAPYKSVVAFGIIKNIIEMTPKKMWTSFSSVLGIDKQRFDDYFYGKLNAIGIELSKIIKIDPVHLDKIRNIDPKFQPPQIYKYISNINNYKAIINLMQLPF